VKTTRFPLGALLLWAACATAFAAEVKTYRTTLDVAPSGDAQARAELRIVDARAGRLRLPVAFPGLDGFAVASAPPSVAVRAEPGKGQSIVEIELPEGVPPEVAVSFTFTVPKALFEPRPEEGQKAQFAAGTRLLRHGFVNTQATAIADYRLVVKLPDGTVVQKIRDQQPRPSRKEFVPRVELDRFDGRQGALLQLAGMRQGDRTSMELEVVGQGRSWMWAAVGAVLVALWLFGYRYLLTPQKA
jgi:hypothetical protein